MRAAPAVSCAIVRRRTHTSIQVKRRTSDIPCAMVLRLMPCSPRRRIRSCHRHQRIWFCQTRSGPKKPPPTWHQQRMPGPHGFAVRFSAVRLRAADRSRAFRQPALRSRVTPNAAASTASHPNVRDVADAPLSGTGCNGYEVICVRGEAEYLRKIRK